MGNPVRPIGTDADVLPVAGPGPVVARPVPVPSRELPPSRQERFNRTLMDVSKRVGNVLGVAVERARHIPHRVGEIRQSLIIARGRTTQDASAAAAEWQQTARKQYHEARTRAEYIANEYPVQVIAGAAAVAFVVGFALRIWRSSNARD